MDLSFERDFARAKHRDAITRCNDLDQLKEITYSLLDLFLGQQQVVEKLGEA